MRLPTGSLGDRVWGRCRVRLLSPAGRGRQERREVAGNGESLRNVSRRERWARGTRKNAQTKTQSGGGEASEAVGAEQSLKKKKNQTAKRSLSPIHAPRHGFLLVENVRSFDTSTNKRPYPNPVVQVRNTTAVSGGAGLGIYEQVSPTFMPNPKSSPLRAGPPSAAAASDLFTPQSQRGDP